MCKPQPPRLRWNRWNEALEEGAGCMAARVCREDCFCGRAWQVTLLSRGGAAQRTKENVQLGAAAA